MQSQLEWSQKKFIKFEMRKGESKEQNKQWLKKGFSNSVERWREERKLEILLGGILAIQCISHAEDKIQELLTNQN